MTENQQSLWQRWLQALLGIEATINRWQGWRRVVFFVVVVLIVLPPYLVGAFRHKAEYNRLNYWVDQHDYVNYAIRLHETDYNYYGDHNRMPLYPFLQSLHYEPDMDILEYFDAAKRFNIYLSMLVLIGVFFVYLQLFGNLVALNLFLVTAFTFYVFKAPYIQAELVYNFFLLCAYILMLKMFIRPTWILAIGTGVMLALAQYTKASVLPVIGLFVLFSTAQVLYQWWRYRRGARRLFMLIAVVVVFLGLMWPYISHTKEVFGQYFYNVNTTFYIWYDSWEEAKQGVRLYGDYYQWPDMPEDEIPSLRKYLREHSIGDIIERIADGYAVSAYRHTKAGYGYFWYIFIPLLLLIELCWRAYKSEQRLALMDRVKTHGFLILFALAFFVGYLTLYAFYVAIHSGPRFMLSLYLPMTFSLVAAINLPTFAHLRFTIRGVEVRWVTLFNVVLLVVVIIHAILNVTIGVVTIHAAG